MRVGILLPTFRDDATDAFDMAQRAAESGLDGVFAYDHLWPMGQPHRPALTPFPVLAAVSARVPSIMLGPLVARVGLVAPEHLVQQFRTLGALAPGRVMAPLGTGDRLSAEENRAYGIAYPSANERQDLLARVARELRNEFEVWIGAGASRTNEIARELGVVLNVWNKSVTEIDSAITSGAWNWAGNARDDIDVQLSELQHAGATWAVFSPSAPVKEIAAWRLRNS